MKRLLLAISLTTLISQVCKADVRLEYSVMIPMRDGVRLATDLYFPKGVSDKLPAILIRTPYNKNTDSGARTEAMFFAENGYVVAIQDVRGKFESEGNFVVQAPDADDSYDTVSWLARQPWCNAKVGTVGCSYRGETQIFLAKRRNPYHAAMIPRAAGAVYRYLAILNGGALEMALHFGWMRENGSKVHLQVPPGTSEDLRRKAMPYFSLEPNLPEIDYPTIWRTLPLVEMMQKAKTPPTSWEEFVTREPDDPWWDQFNLIKETDRFDVPALHINSWYDYGVGETLKTFELLKRNSDSAKARQNQFVIISPTTHCRSENAKKETVVGERPVGDARLGFQDLYLNWMDYWLKGSANDVTKMAPVQFYTMGLERWRSAETWPLPGTRYTKYYLHSQGAANSLLGDGSLDPVHPKDEPSDTFIYDPADPVPSVGGPLCCTGSPDAPEGAFDQSEVEMRKDVLVYTTPVLKEGLDVTGPLKLILFVSSSERDTDFTAKLVDVYPDGKAYNVQEAILRSRYREGFDKRAWMTEGEVYRLEIDLASTSNYFPAGHKIRLEVSSSNFPRFDRNLNTGGNNHSETSWRIARNSVHHSQVFPSHLVLPIIPKGDSN